MTSDNPERTIFTSEETGMPADVTERIQGLLKSSPSEGRDAAKKLLWTELNYDRVSTPLSHRNWPDGARNALAEPPTLLAQHGSPGNSFDVVYARLAADQRGRASPLSITAERLVINQLLNDHPYALFVFSDAEEKHWHLINVRYDADTRKRRIFRRIAVGPHEHLRTAAERVAMLDTARMSGDGFGLSPLAVQRRHDDAFNVEAVTDEFFKGYQKAFNGLQDELRQQTDDARWAHDFALQFLNRLMFLYYVQRKRWLGDDPDFLANFWKAYRHSSTPRDTFVPNWLNVLFFEAFNNQFQAGRADRQYLPQPIRNALAMAPFLNGGLFERNRLDAARSASIGDARFAEIFAFLEGYNFTITEDTPLDQEVAVDPEMIGKVYESLVNVSDNVDERGEAGIFYTPPVEIDLMCRLSLVDYLTNHLGAEHRSLLYETVFAFDPDEKECADGKAADLNLWPRLNELLSGVTVVDPACGSGSFLVGMLYVLDDLLLRAGRQLGSEETPYERKKSIIRDSLYGVDVMDWAVHVAELRLWLQLVIDTDLAPAELKFRPLLPNLSFKVRPGDSLVQEVGGINMAMRTGSGAIPSTLQGRLTTLKGEKLKFYNNDRTCRYHSDEEVRHAELQVFRDIMDARAKAIDEKLKQIEDGLRPQTNLFGEIQSPQMGLERIQWEQERDRLTPEREQVRAAREALQTVRDVPFVWDIAFVEVFEGARRGFDIVVGNPPYVRQEAIRNPHQTSEEVAVEDKRAYKAQLMRSVYTTWPLTFDFNWASDKPRWKLDAKSDLYIYFYFHGLSLLNDKGTFCFITSNSWLDVGYGKDLQEFLLTRGQVRLVIDNQARRSFASADVNTIIVLLGAPQDAHSPRPDSLDHTARFVMLTVPFEDVLGPVIWDEVDETHVRRTKPEYRIHPAKQSTLLASGMDPEKKAYAGDKWGGKYLRAPDIYWTILERAKDKLVRLSEAAKYDYGIKPGAVSFFYLSDEQAEVWAIEKNFLRPIITSTQTLKGLTIVPDSWLFSCQLGKRSLAGTNALKYIQWGEQQGIHRKVSVRSHRPFWYSLSGEPVEFLLLQFWDKRFWTPFASDVVYCSNNFFYGRSKVAYRGLLRGLLNTTFHYLQICVVGRVNQGLGVLNTYGPDFAHVLTLNASFVEALTLQAAFDKLASRPVLTIFEELSQPDRRALDDIIFDALGLTQGERDAVYEGAIRLVETRLKKAGSLDRRPGMEEDEE
jgi:hypothetical protein